MEVSFNNELFALRVLLKLLSAYSTAYANNNPLNSVLSSGCLWESVETDFDFRLS